MWLTRVTRLRPSGRGADTWDELHPTQAQQRELYDWLLAHGEDVLTGDSFFHLAGYGESLPGLNLCGAGRVVCLIDPVGDVYACPFAIHDAFLAGNVRDAGGFTSVWRESELFRSLREPQSGGACEQCSAWDACRGGCGGLKKVAGYWRRVRGIGRCNTSMLVTWRRGCFLQLSKVCRGRSTV